MKREILDWICVIATIIMIVAGITLFIAGLFTETPWRLVITDVAILVTSALVMRITSNGMNFSIDVDN